MNLKLCCVLLQTLEFFLELKAENIQTHKDGYVVKEEWAHCVHDCMLAVMSVDNLDFDF